MFDPDELAHRVSLAAELLEEILEDRGVLAYVDEPLQRRLLVAAGRVARPTTQDRRRLRRERARKKRIDLRDHDAQLASNAQIRKLRENQIFQTPRRQNRGEKLPPTLGTFRKVRICYVCNEPYQDLHFFYDQLCPACGDFNYRKRSPEGDLKGRVALVTGARVKIGYHAAILLLRSGCRVVATTRFPRDAARRYASEPDFEAWSDRLEIAGLDLRRIGDVEDLCAELVAHLPRLDFIINNACQTVRRPPGFYDHLMQAELTDGGGELARLLPGHRASGGTRASVWSALPLLPGDTDRSAFPEGRLDADLQQVDERMVNSWRLKLDEVPPVELLEVHLVNAMAPFLLNARLKPLMVGVSTRDKHIVNVSAMEGQFYRTFKSDRHPHTNMAKASLNMMTRTSAPDYLRDGIHMNSVDTGWVTDEDPIHHAERKREEHGFHPPLDVVDGAARIVDPIFDGLATGEHVWGQFLKDYKPTDW